MNNINTTHKLFKTIVFPIELDKIMVNLQMIYKLSQCWFGFDSNRVQKLFKPLLTNLAPLGNQHFQLIQIVLKNKM